MTFTRRQFAGTLAGAAGLFGASGTFAQDDDDRPPNVFISPPGKPFRARRGAPYPVVDWFRQADKNGDGKLDHAEFLADADAFFAVLDVNGDGVLDPFEIQVYERKIAPEIIGYRVEEGAWRPVGARLWLAQMDSPDEMQVGPTAPQEGEPSTERPKGLDESLQGASPFGFFNAPEPVTAADADYRGLVFKANFMKLADRHFHVLDADNAGFLTLAKLPKTEVQKQLEHGRRG